MVYIPVWTGDFCHLKFLQFCACISRCIELTLYELHDHQLLSGFYTPLNYVTMTIVWPCVDPHCSSLVTKSSVTIGLIHFTIRHSTAWTCELTRIILNWIFLSWKCGLKEWISISVSRIVIFIHIYLVLCLSRILVWTITYQILVVFRQKSSFLT